MRSKTIALYEPFSELTEFSPFFGRIFERMFGDLPTALKEELWIPAVDIEEKDGNIEVKAELPGMQKDDIKVTVRDNILTLSGERKHEEKTDNKTYHRIERTYGKFIRTIALPVTVSADKVKAQYRDGVLHITLAKPETLKPADIKIETN